MREKIILTGGAGFIGANLSRKLLETGKEVIIIDDLSHGYPNNVPEKAVLLPISIGNAELGKKLAPAIGKDPVSIIHLAAQIDVRMSVANPFADAQNNIMEFLKFMALCSKMDVEKFVFASSGGAIYGRPNSIPTSEKDLENPQNPYGVSKLAVEKYLDCYRANYGLSFVALRLANIYGPMQNSAGEAGVIAIFCRSLLQNTPIVIYGSGEQTRDFVYVDDVVNAFMRSLDTKKTGIYNIGTGRETSINKVLGHLATLHGKGRLDPTYEPPKKGEQLRSCLNAQKAKKELGWKPTVPINEGLKHTYEWFDRQNIANGDFLPKYALKSI